MQSTHRHRSIDTNDVLGILHTIPPLTENEENVLREPIKWFPVKRGYIAWHVQAEVIREEGVTGLVLNHLSPSIGDENWLTGRLKFFFAKLGPIRRYSQSEGTPLDSQKVASRELVLKCDERDWLISLNAADVGHVSTSKTHATLWDVFYQSAALTGERMKEAAAGKKRPSLLFEVPWNPETYSDRDSLTSTLPTTTEISGQSKVGIQQAPSKTHPHNLGETSLWEDHTNPSEQPQLVPTLLLQVMLSATPLATAWHLIGTHVSIVNHPPIPLELNVFSPPTATLLVASLISHHNPLFSVIVPTPTPPT